MSQKKATKISVTTNEPAVAIASIFSRFVSEFKEFSRSDIMIRGSDRETNALPGPPSVSSKRPLPHGQAAALGWLDLRQLADLPI